MYAYIKIIRSKCRTSHNYVEFDTISRLFRSASALCGEYRAVFNGKCGNFAGGSNKKMYVQRKAAYHTVSFADVKCFRLINVFNTI